MGLGRPGASPINLENPDSSIDPGTLAVDAIGSNMPGAPAEDQGPSGPFLSRLGPF